MGRAIVIVARFVVLHLFLTFMAAGNRGGHVFSGGGFGYYGAIDYQVVTIGFEGSIV
jgi:hypothetical protein